jgi:prepilin-type N-terminal cleavage/methylation domain-containing protein
MITPSRYRKIKKSNFSNGFTLIELLVVISIIGILVAVVSVSFSSSQKQARDTKRKSDLKFYQNALEVYANKNNGMYPMFGCSKVVANDIQLCSSLSVDSNNCPPDPKYATDPTNYTYYYRSDGTGNNGIPKSTQYLLWAKIENVSTPTYWVICSNGTSGKTTTNPDAAGAPCPTLTQ